MTIVDDPTDAPPARNGSTPPITAPITQLRPTPQLATPPDEADDELVVAEEEFVAAPGSAKMLRVTRFAAVSITAIIGIASFILSFASLSDLAERASYPHNLAPLWPIIVDGTILASTMGVLALGPYGQQQRHNRRFFWWVLAIAALVSVGCNGLHAIIPPGTPLSPWLKAAVGVVPPVSLLATAHGAAILSRVRPMTVKAVREQAASHHAQLAEARRQHWLSIARIVQEQNSATRAIAERPTEQVAEILEGLHKGVSKRAICAQTNLHHEVVTKIEKAANALQRSVAVASE
jgi:Protein of unknown function (DUF2637)